MENACKNAINYLCNEMNNTQRMTEGPVMFLMQKENMKSSHSRLQNVLKAPQHLYFTWMAYA